MEFAGLVLNGIPILILAYCVAWFVKLGFSRQKGERPIVGLAFLFSITFPRGPDIA